MMPRTNAQRKYDAKMLKRFSFAVNRKTEADILAHLEDMTDRSAYIKRLVREDMKRNA